VKTAATVSPTECEIAILAYRLWLDKGCPGGSDREDWFRAEAMLKAARAETRGDLSKPSSIPRSQTSATSEILAEFRWDGHWEVWESEWGGARWVWDLQYAKAGVEISSRAASASAAR
jgi:hypothetical protein